MAATGGRKHMGSERKVKDGQERGRVVGGILRALNKKELYINTNFYKRTYN